MNNKLPIADSVGELKLKRLLIDYEEKLNWQKSKMAVMNRLLQEKINEKTVQLKERIGYLNNIESATLNILEDAREFEAIIKEERDQVRAIISSMGEGLLVVDPDHKIILLNKTAEFLLGIPENEIIGQDARKIIKVFKQEKEIPDEERPVMKMFKTQSTVKIEIEENFYYYVVPSGKKFPVALVVTPLRGNGITGAILVFRDITREKQLDEARTSFVSIASHQLRTPLTAIRWYTEMLQGGDAGQLNEDQKNFLNQIYGGVLRLGDTLNTLLFLARVEGGQTKFNASKTNIVQFTETVIKELEPLVKQKNLKLTIDAEQKCKPFEVFVDQPVLNQVIVNLLSNAIRYTNEGELINIKITCQKNEILYSVKDNGIGIPESQKNRIFEKFFRADNAITKVPEGNGLGLVLVKKLVEAWKGKIWFESQEGKGTTFYFTIPI